MKMRATRYQKVMSLLALSVLVGLFVFLIMRWGHLPERIPAHYNAAGEVDRWGGRGELLLCPVIAAAIWLVITLLESRPGLCNTGVTVTRQNRTAVYRETRNLIVTLKLTMALTFALIAVCQTLGKPLPGWFLPVDLLLIFGPMVFFLVRLVQAARKPK